MHRRGIKGPHTRTSRPFATCRAFCRSPPRPEPRPELDVLGRPVASGRGSGRAASSTTALPSALVHRPRSLTRSASPDQAALQSEKVMFPPRDARYRHSVVGADGGRHVPGAPEHAAEQRRVAPTRQERLRVVRTSPIFLVLVEQHEKRSGASSHAREGVGEGAERSGSAPCARGRTGGSPAARPRRVAVTKIRTTISSRSRPVSVVRGAVRGAWRRRSALPHASAAK